jgi:hypothetical protein
MHGSPQLESFTLSFKQGTYPHRPRVGKLPGWRGHSFQCCIPTLFLMTDNRQEELEHIPSRRRDYRYCRLVRGRRRAKEHPLSDRRVGVASRIKSLLGMAYLISRDIARGRILGIHSRTVRFCNDLARRKSWRGVGEKVAISSFRDC